MLSIDIPGNFSLRLDYLILDYNGTLAFHGKMVPQSRERLIELSSLLTIHVVTADTFGVAGSELDGLPVELFRLGPKDQAQAKLEHLKSLGPQRTAAIGNGLNDHLMLEASKLGIAIVGPEGASTKTIASADVLCPSIISALELLIFPQRLIATLRS
ncbi:MAG: HAD hydrolase family protein [Deltaproteobacteria bacterium]|nr:HAD hydrolase family protein [Deltaproteobacteria bacterium]